MFFYQAAIMLAVVLLLGLIAYVIKIRSHLVLAALFLIFAAAGAGGLCLIQNVFSSHFYEQKIDTAVLQSLQVTQSQKDRLRTVFSDYRKVTDPDFEDSLALSKSYTVSGDGAISRVNATIYLMDNRKSADEFFTLSKRFYANKNYMPEDSKLSMDKKDYTHKYITSYIKSSYPDYKDIVYFPSKIVYLSDVVVQDDNVIVVVHEKSNHPVTNKNKVLTQIAGRLEKTR